jgi:uncharacterized membrane protein YkvA (DUF1232 family)
LAAEEPFPRARFGAMLRRLPRYGRLAWSLSRHPKVTGKRRLALIAAAMYLVSPIDLVPGFIPVAGQLDDAAAILIAIGLALRSLQPAERTAALAAVGLEASDIDDDLRTIGVTYKWIGRQGLKLGMTAGRVLAHGAERGVRMIRGRIRGRETSETGSP